MINFAVKYFHRSIGITLASVFQLSRSFIINEML